MSRFVMTLGLVSSLSVAWIAFEPLVANATTTTGTTIPVITSSTGVTTGIIPSPTTGMTANPQDAVNPAQLTSAQIVQIQNSLNNAGFSVITTGRWDPATASALQQFQASRTFVSNGMLTNQTLASLGLNFNVGGTSFGTAATGASPAVNAVNNTFAPNSLSSAQISELQQALRNRGFNVAVNGIWGPSTIAAIQQFETSQGRAATGTLSNQTVADLGIALNAPTSTASANAAANLNAIAPAAGGLNGTPTTGTTTFNSSTGTTTGTVSSPTTLNTGATTTTTFGTTGTNSGGAKTTTTGSVSGTVP